MASVSSTRGRKLSDYPSSDGRPLAETDIHYKAIRQARQTLDTCYADEPMVHVSGNLLLFYCRRIGDGTWRRTSSWSGAL